jgi:hypothetical protein
MKKIIIIGKGVGWELAPLEGETWGVNDLCLRRPVKVIFNLHKDSADQFHKDINNFAEKTNTPLFRLCDFPLDKMHTDYFTNSIAMMIAYAVYIEVDQIDLYGCVLWGGSEYAFQKPNVEYWVGYARGKGVKVNIKGHTNLLRSETGMIYGYDLPQKEL